ncbi:hypothetical protein TorRG33x02_301170 [Trema orientale]|uniref:Uncharacterized protein n=1 Tax=Trema orientale TaxID=63057 RepID=A0A2P5C1I4_TREOI|nr:hypothetical protein TorRG33x02_301170 [Trema orientale]
MTTKVKLAESNTRHQVRPVITGVFDAMGFRALAFPIAGSGCGTQRLHQLCFPNRSGFASNTNLGFFYKSLNYYFLSSSSLGSLSLAKKSGTNIKLRSTVSGF